MVKEFTKGKKRQREKLLSNIEVEGSSWGRDHGTEREWEVLQQLRGSYMCELCKQVDRQVSRCLRVVRFTVGEVRLWVFLYDTGIQLQMIVTALL